MSRIGRKPIEIPSNVTVNLNGNNISVKGPKGELSREIRPEINIVIEGNILNVERKNDNKMSRGLHGLSRTLISNMIIGVSEGFTKSLEINGVGYRAAKQGRDLVMNLGYSHQVIMSETDDITIDVPAPNKIDIKGADKQKVGQFAAEVRLKRPPEPYKGKGIKYVDEVIIRKEGKAAKK